MLNRDGVTRRSVTNAAELHNKLKRHKTVILANTDVRILVMVGIKSAKELKGVKVAKSGVGT